MMFEECKTYFSDFKKAFSSLQSSPLSHEASPSTKKLNISYLKRFWHFDTLDIQKPYYHGDIDFMAQKIFNITFVISPTHY